MSLYKTNLTKWILFFWRPHPDFNPQGLEICLVMCTHVYPYILGINTENLITKIIKQKKMWVLNEELFRKTKKLWENISTYLSRFQFILQIVLANAFIADSQPPRYFLLVLHESTHTQHHHSLEVALMGGGLKNRSNYPIRLFKVSARRSHFNVTVWSPHTPWINYVWMAKLVDARKSEESWGGMALNALN